MKKIFLALAIVLIAIIGCDILNHDVFVDDDLESFFTDFSTAFEIITADDMDAVMNFYSDDYSNNLQDKDAIRNFYLDFFNIYTPVRLEAKLIEYNRFDEITWNLNIYHAEQLVETISMDDVTNKNDNQILFWGNQIDPPALDPTKPVVFAEFFTGESCGNCPPAAAHLHHLKNHYGGQFIYVEYCSSHGYTPFYNDYAQYYNAFGQPSTVIQGRDIVIGGASADLESIDSFYESSSSEELTATISNIIITENSAGYLTGNLEINFIQAIPTENLILTVVIADEKPDIFYTGTTERFHNIAYEKTEIEISVENIIDFNINYNEDIEFNKKKVIAWLQTRPEEFGTDSKIHAAAEFNITQ